MVDSVEMSAADSLVYGRHAVFALCKRRISDVRDVWIVAGRTDAKIERLLEAAVGAGAGVHRISRRELDAMVDGARHQGIVIRCNAPSTGAPVDIDDLLMQLDEPPFLLVLDCVQDPHNLGACLRTAAAVGVHAVVVPGHDSARLTAVVRKVASGAAESVPLVRVANLARTLRALSQRGVLIVGTAVEADNSLYDLDLTGPLALVLGGESRGLRHLTREHCDWLLRIPMMGSVESVNVSVATGVCLFEALRQRQA